MTGRVAPRAAGGHGTRLTRRGVGALAALYLLIGPTCAFGFGIPLCLISACVKILLFGIDPGVWGPVDRGFLLNIPASLLTVVIGLPFYGPWAEAHLWPVAAWVAATMTLVATTRRGLRVGDAALVAAAAVLAYPALVDADGPQLKWGYPDAVYMALAAAGGAALCTALVRGFGERGLRRRRAWGWIVRDDSAAASP